MLSVYPYASGSLYIAGHTTTASFAPGAQLIRAVTSASNADVVLFPVQGDRGKSVCLLTTEQYNTLVATGKFEICNFS